MSYTTLSHAGPRDTAADGRVVSEVRDAILAGRLGAGERLNQAELAAALGVSRIPVRDALQRLAGEGLVEIRGRGGTFVSALSVSDLGELYELREAVEPLAARHGLPNMGRAELLRMEQLHRQLADEQDPQAWLSLNAQFHGQLHGAAGRPRMVALVERLRRLTDRYLHLHLSVVGAVDRLHEEHAAILDATRRRDAAAVAEATRVHLATSHNFILSLLLEHDIQMPTTNLEETP